MVSLRLRAEDGAVLDAMAFRSVGTALGQALAGLRGERIHVLGTLSIDRWQGSERVQLRVVDAAAPAR